MQVLVFCVAACLAAAASASECLDLPVVQNFDLSQVSGDQETCFSRLFLVKVLLFVVLKFRLGLLSLQNFVWKGF